MAKVFLSSGDEFTISNNNVEVIGAAGTGTEKVTIQSGIKGVKTDANIERLDVAGNLSGYTFQAVAGTGVVIKDASGNTVATIPSVNQNVTVAFADGSATLVQTGGSAFTLGGQAISTTATAAITSTAMGTTNFNTAVTSGSGTSTGTTTGQTFTLTDSAPTLDKSTSTSAVEITLAGATVALSGTGSAQADTFKVLSFSASKGATISGGAGDDKVDFSSFGSAVNVNQEVNYNSSGAAGLTMSSIESVVGTSLADSITGSAGNDTIQGGVGSDTLNGRSGDDTFVYTNASAELTGDTVDGGAGTDVILSSDSLVDVSGVTISNVEKIKTTSTAATTITVAATQVGSTKVTAIEAGSSTTNTLKVATTTDLSAVTLTNIKTVELAATGNMVVGASNLVAGTIFKANTSGTDDLYIKGAGETYDLTTVTLSGIQEVKDTSTGVKSDVVVINQSVVKSSSSETGKVDTITLGNATTTGGAGTDTLKLSGNVDLQYMAGSSAGVVANKLDFGTATQVTLKEATYTIGGSIVGGSGSSDRLIIVEDTGTAGTDISAQTATISGVEQLVYSGAASTTFALNATQFSSVGTLMSANAASLKLAVAGTYDMSGKQIAGFTSIADNGAIVNDLMVSAVSNFGTITSIADQAANGVVNVKLNAAGTYDFSGVTTATSAGSELVVAGSTGNDVITAFTATAATKEQTINADRGNDSVVGSLGADTINGGEGNDTMVGGASTDKFLLGAASGTDTIYLGASTGTLTDGSADIVKFDFSTAASLKDVGVKTIYGFEAKTGSDVIQFTTGLLAGTDASTTTGELNSTVVTEVTALNNETAFTALGTTVFVEVANDITAANATDAGLVWAQIVSGTSGVTYSDAAISKQNLIIAIDDGTDSYLWAFSSASGNTVASSGDITLVGVVKGVTDFDSGDFVVI